MIFVDRITGDAASELPPDVVPGRFIVSAETILNGHAAIASGSILVDDGSLICALGEHRRRFAREELSPEQATSLKVARTGVETIARMWTETPDELPCPLLPMDVLEASEPSNLERELRRVLLAGHLQVISHQPRLDMQYSEEPMPVSRVRRTSKRALQHLASHSEDVQFRTSGGVVPKILLAKLSEDDYAIYENRVYARLLDHLERYLRVRKLDQQELRRQIEQALSLEDAETRSPELRRAICDLWGDSFDTMNLAESFDRSARLGAELDRLLLAVRGLKQRGLYQFIPKTARIPDQIRITNILSHDQHYRHLVTLWHGVRTATVEDNLTPNQIFQKNQADHSAYVDFVGVVLFRVIKRHRPGRIRSVNKHSWEFSEGGRAVFLERSGDTWMLRDGVRNAVLIPFLNTGLLDLGVRASASETRIVCMPLPSEGAAVHETPTDAGLRRLWVSPLDLCVEERMACAIEPWLRAPTFRAYGRIIQKVPAAVMEAASKMPELECPDASAIRFITPPRNNRSPFIEIVKRHANATLAKDIGLAMSEVDDLAHCWGCGDAGRMTPQAQSGFRARCDRCELEWFLGTTENTRSAFFRRFSFNGDFDRAFDRYGRWILKFTL